MGKTHDNGTCLSCGGAVDAEGYAEGGAVKDDDAAAVGPKNPSEVSDDSPQFELNKRMRHAALASALKGK